MAEKNILTTHEYAEKFGVSVSNTKKNAREGKIQNLPGVKEIKSPEDPHSRCKYLLVMS